MTFGATGMYFIVLSCEYKVYMCAKLSYKPV